MSFFSKLYQALGFGNDIDYDTEVSSEAEGAVPMEQAAVEPQAVVLKDEGVGTDMRSAIFNHVLEVFNSALPDFLARSVNPEAQRKLLFESLDQGLKDYLSQLAVDADQRCQQRWSSEQTQLRSEMDNLKRKSEQVESERSELRERQLSAERQKRALSNRLKELEMQVEKLDAEREQYDLENKSLMNKLKVMAVQNPEAAENLQDADTIIANVEDLQRKLEEVSQENESLRTQLQEAAERQNMADAMCNDLRRKLASANKDVEDLQAITEQVAIVQQAIEERDNTISDQRDKIAHLKVRIKDLERAKPSKSDETVDDARLSSTTSGTRRRKGAHRHEEEISIAPKITDDDLLDVENGFADHNWFGIDEPESQPKAPLVKSNDKNDFGYRAPEPKPKPFDDGQQMSLFD